MFISMMFPKTGCKPYDWILQLPDINTHHLVERDWLYENRDGMIGERARVRGSKRGDCDLAWYKWVGLTTLIRLPWRPQRP
jgi:hypothetical protein